MGIAKNYFMFYILIQSVFIITIGCSPKQNPNRGTKAAASTGDDSSNDLDKDDLKLTGPSNPRTVFSGDNLTGASAIQLTTSVQGDHEDISYQWYRNDVPLQNTNQSTYLISRSNVKTMDSAEYRVVVRVGSEVLYSRTAAFFVASPEQASQLAQISTQPNSSGNIHLTEGDRLELSVQSTSASAQIFTWYRDSTALENSNSPTLRIDSVELTHKGEYKVKIENDFGEIISDYVNVSVAADTSCEYDSNEVLLSHFDGIESGWAAGWVINPKDTCSPLKIEFWEDTDNNGTINFQTGRLAGYAETGILRNDVSNFYEGVGAMHGFRTHIPRTSFGYTIHAFAVINNQRYLLSNGKIKYNNYNGLTCPNELSPGFNEEDNKVYCFEYVYSKLTWTTVDTSGGNEYCIFSLTEQFDDGPGDLENIWTTVVSGIDYTRCKQDAEVIVREHYMRRNAALMTAQPLGPYTYAHFNFKWVDIPLTEVYKGYNYNFSLNGGYPSLIRMIRFLPPIVH